MPWSLELLALEMDLQVSLFCLLLYFQELGFYGNTLRINTDLKGKAKLIEIPSF